MAQCKNCQFVIAMNESNARGCCTLTRYVVQTDKEHECPCFNRDLSEYDICYNCEYYSGGGDWGLFCYHKGMYHHLGKFSDDPCEYYQKKKAKELPTCQDGGEYADAPTMMPGA